jgi:hypothetical protein
MSIYRRDLSSGMVHEVDESGRSHEADNLDDAGAFELITLDELEATPTARKCRRCFPLPDDADPEHDDPIGSWPVE